MDPKMPVLLVMLVETERLRWFVAEVGMEGDSQPLICSEEGNLSPYLDLEADEQLAFLRHRFSGVLQRGCNRIWSRGKKPFQIVFSLDGPFLRGKEGLEDRLAEHFVEWLSNPPVVFTMGLPRSSRDEQPRLRILAGEPSPSVHDLLAAHLPMLRRATCDETLWELLRPKVC